ncbi:MAG: flagellar hook-length control protein FliK [Azoarcus sp.]|nr:flagellar hook-length control protein FliK [Azoarcus sp.]
MATPVSSGTLNLSASSAAANSDASRSAANAALKPSFSDLLRGQIRADSGANVRTPEITRQPPPQAARTPERPPSEAARETSRPSDNSPAPANKEASRPSRDAARADDSPSETGEAVAQQAETQDTPAPQQADAPTDEKEQTSESDATAAATQPSSAEAAAASAMIAALPNGIASVSAETAPDPETSVETAPDLAGRSRHSGTASLLLPQDAADSATQGEPEGSEPGANPDAPDDFAFMARKSQHPASAITLAAKDEAAALASNGASPRLNAAALNTIMNTASAQFMNPVENGGAKALPAGIAETGGDIPILNPPRLSSQPGAALPQFTIPAGAGQKGWAEEIGNRVMWMMGRAENRAELILTPPHLGKVEVSIHLNGDQSTAQFLASSQSARDALEQAMPRLRELLAQAGISLGEASVNTSGEGRAQDSENTRHTGMRHADAHDGSGGGEAPPEPPPGHWSRLDSGLVNTFA